jgi:PIN domain nuclease of toxin-antitoxin system
MAPAVLLDTCAVIWMVNGHELSAVARAAIIGAADGGGVLVSPISAWEIGLLCRRGPGALSFLPDPKTWFARVLSAPGIRVAPFSADIAIESSLLPGSLHNDPADRIMIAMARNLDVPLITRDRAILGYAATGHVRAIAC